MDEVKEVSVVKKRGRKPGSVSIFESMARQSASAIYQPCRNGSLRHARRYLAIAYAGAGYPKAIIQAMEILSSVEQLCTTINALGGIPRLKAEDNSKLSSEDFSVKRDRCLKLAKRLAEKRGEETIH